MSGRWASWAIASGLFLGAAGVAWLVGGEAPLLRLGIEAALWFGTAAGVIAIALRWSGGTAIAAVSGLLLVLLAAAALVGEARSPDGLPGIGLRIAYLWLMAMLLVAMLDSLRGQRARLQEELVHLRAANLRLDAVLSTIGTSVLVVDRQGWIRRANRGAEELTARTAALLKGVLVDAVVHLGWPPPASGRSEIPVKGGEPIPVAYRVAMVGDEQLVMLHDLRAHYTALADLETRAEELATAGMTQSRFVAAVSHQLRTPMDSLVGEATRLLDSGPLDARQRRYVSIINRGARQLLELLDDMLLLTTLDAGLARSAGDRVTVLRLLHEVGIPRPRTLEAVAASKGLPTVRVDRQWTDRIFREIIDPMPFVGAPPMRFHHTLGTTTYRLEVPSRRLEPGQGEEFVFSPHFPEHEGASPLSNTRLGLMLARELARGLGGDLGVRFVKDDGRFVLELPLVSADET